jgi:hypothetical protein
MHEQNYALSDRQLRRWLAGDVASLDGARPANARVAEAEFGWPIDALLTADERQRSRASPLPESLEARGLKADEFVAWIAEHSALDYGEAYRQVCRRIDDAESTPYSFRHAHDRELLRVTRADLASWLSAYYGTASDFYAAQVGRAAVTLSVVAPTTWTGLSVPLGGDSECCELDRTVPVPVTRLNDRQLAAALDRLAAAEMAGTVLVNDPLYRLVGLEVGGGGLRARFACVDFADYALTADLMERELRGALQQTATSRMSLREAWLPTTDAGLAFDLRVCAGGPLCLVAIADGEQYQLLVQERSSKVLNVAGALAVIPKAFHQPIVDPFGETRISTTIERELEEELLGRPDLEQLSEEYGRRAAPLHPANAPAPMRWLGEHPDAWQMECTGFGINMVTGTFEFGCLVVVHDPEWWSSYGHMLEANWEAKRLHRYSSLDGAGIEQLVSDPSWSNEGLFAFVEGLRRLVELGTPHVRVPPIERMQ